MLWLAAAACGSLNRFSHTGAQAFVLTPATLSRRVARLDRAGRTADQQYLSPAQSSIIRCIQKHQRQYPFGPFSSFTVTTAATTTTRMFISTTGSNNAEAALAQADQLKAEAERIRLEAERMDRSLTLQKIERLESKLSRNDWLEKHPSERNELEWQLQMLQKRLAEQGGGQQSASLPDSAAAVTQSSSMTPTESFSTMTARTTASVKEDEMQSRRKVDSKDTSSTSSSSSSSSKWVRSSITEKSGSDEPDQVPAQMTLTSSSVKPTAIAGFDEEDLMLYIPVVQQIEATFPANATMTEKIIAFREAPELEDHFNRKIQRLLAPMEEMQTLEELRSQYLYTSSSTEKSQLKRQIDQLEKTMETEGPYSYSDSIYRGLPHLTETELQERLQATQALPEMLQVLFKKRCGLDEDADLTLAIQLDHYEEQLQLLEQVRFYVPLDDETRNETYRAIESLPPAVRTHLVQELGLTTRNHTDSSSVAAFSVDQIVVALTNGADDPAWRSLKQVVEASTVPDFPEYNDIDFIDRSRYIDEFYPSVARLEGQHPTEDEMNQFLKEILDKKTFMARSKPERVVGGYYIRGENCISDDDGAKKLVEILTNRLQASPLRDRVQFFYINDPSPLSDEQVELGLTEQPLLLVTSRNESVFYEYSNGVTKGAVTALSFVGLAIFSLGTCGMEPYFQQRLDAALDAGDKNLSWLIDPAVQIFISSMVIQIIHDMGHRFVAWKDKVRS